MRCEGARHTWRYCSSSFCLFSMKAGSMFLRGLLEGRCTPMSPGERLRGAGME